MRLHLRSLSVSCRSLVQETAWPRHGLRRRRIVAWWNALTNRREATHSPSWVQMDYEDRRVHPPCRSGFGDPCEHLRSLSMFRTLITDAADEATLTRTESRWRAV